MWYLEAKTIVDYLTWTPLICYLVFCYSYIYTRRYFLLICRLTAVGSIFKKDKAWLFCTDGVESRVESIWVWQLELSSNWVQIDLELVLFLTLTINWNWDFVLEHLKFDCFRTIQDQVELTNSFFQSKFRLQHITLCFEFCCWLQTCYFWF